VGEQAEKPTFLLTKKENKAGGKKLGQQREGVGYRRGRIFFGKPRVSVKTLGLRKTGGGKNGRGTILR